MLLMGWWGRNAKTCLFCQVVSYFEILQIDTQTRGINNFLIFGFGISSQNALDAPSKLGYGSPQT
jgi:hypothetical protein